MAYASAPVILDSTGQNIATSLATLAANIAAMKGATGTAGVGVASFVWYSNSGSDPQGTAGTIDTYRMTFTDGNHVDVSVYNGVNGLGALVWGNITGTLSDQTDLSNALNAKADNAVSVSVTIAVSDWVANTATIAVTGVTPTSNIIITPDHTDFVAYSSAQIRATAQGNGTVTFQCETVPNEAITVNVLLVWNPKYSTVSGSVASFYALEAAPLGALLADITAQQDLNGYSKPWAGGAGKNLLPNDHATETVNQVTFTVNSDGSVNVNGTASADTDFNIKSGFVLPAGSYVLSGCPSGGSTSTYRIFATNIGSDTGSGLSFTKTGTTTSTVRINIKSGTAINNLTFTPMIRLSTSSDGYEPYTNICPISGWSDVNIYHEDEYDAGATPAYTIDLNGTRYGGTLDVTTGVLTVTHAHKVFTGSEGISWTTNANYGNLNYKALSTLGMSDWKLASTSAVRSGYGICNLLPPCDAGWTTEYKTNNRVSFTCSGDGYFGFNTGEAINANAKLAEWNSDGNPLTIVYELATPFTVQLTAQQINSLVGQNAVWANTGNVSVTYQIN